MSIRINNITAISGNLPCGTHVGASGRWHTVEDAFAAVGIVGADNFEVDIYTDISLYGTRVDTDISINFDWQVR